MKNILIIRESRQENQNNNGVDMSQILCVVVTQILCVLVTQILCALVMSYY